MTNGDRTGDGEAVSDLEFVEIYRIGFHKTPEAVGVATEGGQLVDINASVERLLRYPRTRVLGRSLDDLGLWVDADERHAARDEVLRTGSTVRRVRLRRGDGAVRDVYVAATLVDVGSRRFLFWVGRDVTGQPLSEQEASDLEDALRRSTIVRRRLVARLIHAAEQERARLEDQLRAGPIQRLTASRLSLGVIRRGVDAAHRHMLERVDGWISDAIDDLRRLSFELRPPVLERQGLGPAVRALLIEFEQSYDLSSALDNRTAAASLSAEASTLAYRVVFDALLGIRDRGGADRVAVSLEARDGDLGVRIRIEGMSFDEAPPTPQALGLEVAFDILSSVGGSGDVRPDASATIVTAVIPGTLS